MRRMYDSAWPPKTPPAWEVAAGYLGGDTPHVWTAAEWAAQPARWRLPIWTRSNPGSAAEGAVEGAAAVLRVRQLGMPAGCAIALDYETAVDDQYLSTFDAAVLAAGYRTLLYGSLSTVEGNRQPSGGYWIAHYTGTPHLEPGSVATQYADYTRLGTDYDASLVDDSLVLWDTKPAPAAATSPAPQQEDEMYTSSNTAGRAGLSWSAGTKHRVQVGLNEANIKFALSVQLVLTTGPVYIPEPWVIEDGTGEYDIPPQYLAHCRGVILTWAPGSASAPYDVYAE